MTDGERQVDKLCALCAQLQGGAHINIELQISTSSFFKVRWWHTFSFTWFLRSFFNYWQN